MIRQWRAVSDLREDLVPIPEHRTGARNYLIGGGAIYALLWLAWPAHRDTTPAGVEPLRFLLDEAEDLQIAAG